MESATFHLPKSAHSALELPKKATESSMVVKAYQSALLMVKTDSLDVATAALLSQNNRPVAFLSRTLEASKKNHSAIEKEARAIVKAVCMRQRYHQGNHLKLLTDYDPRPSCAAADN
nr:unnamed protein product [Fasciola hepatica]